MTRVVRRHGRVVIELADGEADVLADAARQLAGLLDGASGARDTDPALRRLLPDGYRDDPEAAAEFARWTRADLTTAKLAAAESMAQTLTGAREEGLRSIRVPLSSAEATTWMRTITDLRLALAERLEIRTDDDEAPETAAGALYWWLGGLQELIVAALDAEVGR